MGCVEALTISLRAFVVNRAALAAESLALRQQLSVLEQSVTRPKFRPRDRRFWSWLSRLWFARRSVLIVQPETVTKWHRLGFKLYFRVSILIAQLIRWAEAGRRLLSVG